MPTATTDGTRSALTAASCVALLLAAFGVLLVHEDPACYTKRTSGQVTVDRNPDDISGQRFSAGSDVVAAGCTSDTIVWWEAVASMALAAASVVTGLAGAPTDQIAVDLERMPPRNGSTSSAGS